jgi:hypothetical protein
VVACGLRRDWSTCRSAHQQTPRRRVGDRGPLVIGGCSRDLLCSRWVLCRTALLAKCTAAAPRQRQGERVISRRRRVRVVTFASAFAAGTLSFPLSEAAPASDHQEPVFQELDTGTMRRTGTWRFSAAPRRASSDRVVCLRLDTSVETPAFGEVSAVPLGRGERATGTDCAVKAARHHLDARLTYRQCAGGSAFVAGRVGPGIDRLRLRVPGAPSMATRIWRLHGAGVTARVFLAEFDSELHPDRVVAYGPSGTKVGSQQLDIYASDSCNPPASHPSVSPIGA